jgi:hypothetical protein
MVPRPHRPHRGAPVVITERTVYSEEVYGHPHSSVPRTRDPSLTTDRQSSLPPYRLANTTHPALKDDDKTPTKPEVEKPKKRYVKLNLNQPDFPPFFHKFYTSFPSRAAGVEQVQQWLSSWFDAQGAFENDVGVDEYVGRLVLNGQDVREGKFLRCFLGDMNL